MPRYCKIWMTPTIPSCLAAQMRKTLRQSDPEPSHNRQTTQFQNEGRISDRCYWKSSFTCPRVTEDEVTGPAISEKIANVLTTHSPVGFMSKPLSGEKKTFIDSQTANYLLKLVSIPRFGILLKSKHEAWMLGFKPFKTPWVKG